MWSSTMRESVIYQDILQEGERIGEQRGEQRGRQEEGNTLILRQLTRRLGNVTPEIQTKIRTLSLTQLEELGEALLDFSQISELTAWLDAL
jgi:predicted transposase YdaD